MSQSAAINKEQPLDGSVGGALDQAGKGQGDGEIDPASSENMEKGSAQSVQIQAGADLDNKIVEAIQKISDINNKRSILNSEKKVIIEELEALGINKHAFGLTLRYHGMDENKREGIDFSYNYTRRAVGLPIQSELALVSSDDEGQE